MYMKKSVGLVGAMSGSLCKPPEGQGQVSDGGIGGKAPEALKILH